MFFSQVGRKRRGPYQGFDKRQAIFHISQSDCRKKVGRLSKCPLECSENRLLFCRQVGPMQGRSISSVLAEYETILAPTARLARDLRVGVDPWFRFLRRRQHILQSDPVQLLTQASMEGDGSPVRAAALAPENRPSDRWWFQAIDPIQQSQAELTIDVGRPIIAAALLEHGDKLQAVAWDDSDRISLWDLRTGEHVRDLDPPPMSNRPRAEDWDLPSQFDWEVNRILGAALTTLSNCDRIVGGTREGVLVVWDMRSGERLRHWKAHEFPIRGVAVIESRDLIVSCNRESIRFWGIDGKESPPAIEMCESAIECFAISPDRQKVVIGDSDGFVQIWDTQTRRLLSSVKMHDMSISSVATNGQLVVAAARFGPTSVANINDLSNRKPVECTFGYEPAVAVSQLAPLIAIAGDDLNMLDLLTWHDDPLDCDTPWIQKALLEGHRAPVGGNMFDKNGDSLISYSGDGTIRVWPTSSMSLDQPSKWRMLPTGHVMSTPWKPKKQLDLKEQAVGMIPYVLRTTVRDVYCRCRDVNPMAISILGEIVELTSQGWIETNKVERPTSEDLRDGSFDCAIASPSGKTCVIRDKDDFSIVKRRADSRTFDLGYYGRCRAIHDSTPGSITIVNYAGMVFTGRPEHWVDCKSTELLAGDFEFVDVARFKESGDSIVLGSRNRVFICEKNGDNTWQLRRAGEFPHGIVECMCITETNAAFIVGTDRGDLCSFSLATGELIQAYPAHKGGVNAVTLCQRDSIVVTAGFDHTLRVWKRESGQLLANMTLEWQATALDALETPGENCATIMVGDERGQVFFVQLVPPGE
jgi:WD40 repeat protein